MNTTDNIRAHSLGVDLADSQYVRALTAQRNSAQTALLEANRVCNELVIQRDRWYQNWVNTFGALLICILIIGLLVMSR
jgi:uncharacterized membrane protein YjjP (DUF1212 family)